MTDPLPRPDPISVVESAYDLQSSREEWLQRLYREIAPTIARDRGVFMAELEVTGTSTKDWTARPTQAVDDPSTQYFERVAKALRPELVGPALIYAPSVGTVRGLVRQGAVAESVLEDGVRPSTGATDIFTLLAWTPGSTHGLAIAAPSSKPLSLSKARAAQWKQLTSHLAAAYRLRRALAGQTKPPNSPTTAQFWIHTVI